MVMMGCDATVSGLPNYLPYGYVKRGLDGNVYKLPRNVYYRDCEHSMDDFHGVYVV